MNRPGGDVHFVDYDPKPDEMTVAQKKYLKDFVSSFESKLYDPGFKDRSSGYRAYLKVNSFVDYFLIGELSRNVDVYKKSRFYFKDKDSKGGLIHSGPPWDYDWAWKDIPRIAFILTRPMDQVGQQGERLYRLADSPSGDQAPSG